MEKRPRLRARRRRGLLVLGGGLLLVAVTVYYVISPDYGWLYALLFTALPTVVCVVAGIRELVIYRRLLVESRRFVPSRAARGE